MVSNSFAAPESKTIAEEIDFIIEPGSKANCMILLPRLPASVAAGSFGSTVGASAAARIRPVSTSITIALAQSAFSSATVSASTCCAKNCRFESIVRFRLPPSWVGCVTTFEVGILTPSAERSYFSWPSTPARQLLNCLSSPARGVPSLPTKPIRFPATAPLG